VENYATRRRPKMRWLDDVSMDLRKTDVSGWRDSKEPRSLEACCRGGQAHPSDFFHSSVSVLGRVQTLSIYHTLGKTFFYSFTFHGSLQVTEPYGYRISQQKQCVKPHKCSIISNVNNINNVNIIYLLIISSCHKFI
jgi:hypothetical protein